MHTCELCDFSSDLSSDLKRHLETKKHIKKEYLLSVKTKKNDKNMLPFFSDNISNVPNLSPNFNAPIKEMSLKCNDIPNNFHEHENKEIDISDDEKSIESNISNIKKCKNMFLCDCGKSFNHRQNLHTHRKKCKDLKYIETISMLTNKIDTLTKEMEEVKKHTILPINSTTSSNNTNTHSHNTTNSHNNTANILNQKSINVVAYVNQNYSDAKPLIPLKEKDVMQILYVDESCGHSLEEIIIFQHSKYLLDKFLGEFIVTKYVKQDPKKQQIWSSNIKKLTFLVRHVLNKTDKVWLKDSNGVCITKHVITPILAEIRKLIDVYIKLCNEKMHLPHTPTSDFDKFHNIGFHGVKILYEIDQKILHHKILLYIAPYFQLDGIPKITELD